MTTTNTMASAPLLTPVIDDATRREFLTLLAAAGLITGCATPSPAPAGPATRPYTDATGVTSDIPLRAERIVALNNFTVTGPLLALGAPVVGTPDNGSGAFQEWLTAHYDVGAATLIGTAPSVAVETIATLQPDLIVGDLGSEEGIGRAALAEIAPVVYFDTTLPTDDVLAELATIAGRDEEQRAARAEWEQRLAAARARLDLTGLTAVSMRYSGYRPDVELFTPIHPGNFVRVLGALGVPSLPELDAAGAAGEAFYNLSPERVGEIRTDLVVWYEDYAAGRVLDPAVLPTWPTVPAAAAGQVVRAPKELNNIPAYDGLINILDFLEPILAAADRTVV